MEFSWCGVKMQPYCLSDFCEQFAHVPRDLDLISINLHLGEDTVEPLKQFLGEHLVLSNKKDTLIDIVMVLSTTLLLQSIILPSKCWMQMV